MPDDPNIEKAPDHSANDRTYDNYAVYWPGRLADGTLRQPQRPSWRQEGVQRQWRMARYDHRTGEIEVARESANATGWLYHVADLHQNPVPQRAQAPSIRNERPSVCPHCEADWSAGELRAKPHAADRLSEGARCCRTRSLRDRTSQYSGRPVEDPRRKLVLFSDSRQTRQSLLGVAKSHWHDRFASLVMRNGHSTRAASPSKEVEGSAVRRRKR